MKKISVVILASALALLAVSCDKNDGANSENEAAILNVTSEGVSTFAVSGIPAVMTATNLIVADEAEFLYAMREDEKLSKDLYTAFAVQYSSSAQFSRIAAAEASHIAAIEGVLAYYEIEIPVLGEAGVFADTERQSRYDELLAKGSSTLEAFKVMAEVEEGNIDAYNTVLPNVANDNIKLLLENMVKCSSNHLRAAVRQITALGGSYTPTVLSQEQYNGIISSDFAQGNKHAYQYGKGGKHGNTNSQKGGQGQGCKGTVSSSGACTNITTGTYPGTNNSKGQVGKKYRGGR